jgi:hypothetical protein
VLLSYEFDKAAGTPLAGENLGHLGSVSREPYAVSRSVKG